MKKLTLLMIGAFSILILFQNCSNSGTKFGSLVDPTVSSIEPAIDGGIEPTDDKNLTPRDCLSASTSWTVGNNTCNVIYPNLVHRNEKYILNDSSVGPTGRLAVRCNDGRVTEIVGDTKTCITSNPSLPPPQPPLPPPPPPPPICVPKLIGCGNDYVQVAVWPSQNAWYSGVQPENNAICGTSTYNPSVCFRADHRCQNTVTLETQNDPKLGSYVIRNDTIYESTKIYSTCP